MAVDLASLLAGYRPQTRDPYSPIVQSLSMPIAPSQAADPWENITASFVQGLASGIFQNLSDQRQQKIFEERQSYLQDAMELEDKRTREQNFQKAYDSAAIDSLFGKGNASRSFLTGSAPSFGSTLPAMGSVDSLEDLTTQLQKQQQPYSIAQQQSVAGQPVVMDPGAMRTPGTIAPNADPANLSEIDLAQLFSRQAESRGYDYDKAQTYGLEQSKKIFEERAKAAPVLDSLKQAQSLFSRFLPDAEGKTSATIPTLGDSPVSSIIRGGQKAISVLTPAYDEEVQSMANIDSARAQLIGQLKNFYGLTGEQTNQEIDNLMKAFPSLSASDPQQFQESIKRFSDTVKGYEDRYNNQIYRQLGIGPQQQEAPARTSNGREDVDVTPRPEMSLIDAVIQAESGGRNDAVSPKGARGQMQLMPATFNEVKSKYNLEGSIDDPETNRKAGELYLSEQLNRFGGNIELALAAYNSGPGTVQKAIQKAGLEDVDPKDIRFEQIKDFTPQSKENRRETTNYVAKITKNIAKDSGETRQESPSETSQAAEGPEESLGLGQNLAESLLSVTDGMLLPFNRLGAAANAGIDSLFGGQDFGEAYQGYRAGTKDAIERVRQDIGDTGATAAQIAGAVGDPINSLLKAPKTLAAIARRGAGEVGGSSLLNSLIDYFGGEIEGGDVIENTLEGAATGGVAGGALGVGGKALGAVAKSGPAQRVVQRLGNLLSDETGAIRIGGGAPELPEDQKLIDQAVSYLTGRFKEVDPASLASAADELDAAAKQGVPLGLADELVNSGSRSAKTLTRMLSNFGEGADDAGKFLESRSASQGERLSDYVGKLPGDENPTKAIKTFTESIGTVVSKEKKARRAAAEPLYRQAVNETPTIANESLETLRKDAKASSFFQEAIDTVRRENPDWKDLPDNHIEVLAEARRVLRDDVIPSLKMQGRNRVATNVSTLENKLKGTLEKEAPAWAAANEIFKNGSEGINRLSGKQFEVLEALGEENADKVAKSVLSLSRDKLDDLVTMLKPEHSDAMAGLVKAHIRDSITQSGDLTTRSNVLKFASDKMQRDKLALLLGDEAEDVLKFIDREAKISKGNRAYYEGSSTFGNLNEASQTGAEALDKGVGLGKKILNFATSPVAGTLDFVSDGARLLSGKKVNPELEKAILQVLLDTQTGATSARKLADNVGRFQKQRDLVDALVSTGAIGSTRGLSTMRDR